MYFAWFMSLPDSQKLLWVARNWLEMSLKNCPEFRADIEDFSGIRDLRKLLNYYNRQNCLDSNKTKVHCTAKFCGGGQGRERLANICNYGTPVQKRRVGFFFIQISRNLCAPTGCGICSATLGVLLPNSLNIGRRDLYLAAFDSPCNLAYYCFSFYNILPKHNFVNKTNVNSTLKSSRGFYQ
jgi:hypothetical protein